MKIIKELPENVTISVFQAADSKTWHITLDGPFGTSWVRMNNHRDIALAQLLMSDDVKGLQS